MILGASTQFLCHSVDVGMCSEDKVKKGLEGISVWSCPASWGSQSEEAHDFYHGFTCDGHAVHLFDHRSWLLAPNLTISFLSWNYQ